MTFCPKYVALYVPDLRARRLPPAARPLEHRAGLVGFDDPFGFRWVVRPDDSAFRSRGELAGRWRDPKP